MNNLLDNYTMQQVEVMTAAAWQHKLTTLNVVAFAIGGEEAAGRTPSARATPADPGDWSEAKGRWNLATAPTISPEEDERRKLAALSKLMGVQSLQAKASGGKTPRPDGAARLAEQLRAADARRKE